MGDDLFEGDDDATEKKKIINYSGEVNTSSKISRENKHEERRFSFISEPRNIKLVVNARQTATHAEGLRGKFCVL